LLLSVLALVVPARDAFGAGLRISHVTRISSITPFPGPCGRDSPIVTVGAEVEPYIAVDPSDPRRLAVTWMQDSGRSNVVLSSRDRGTTWTRAFVPGLSQCTGGIEPTAADPWLSFGGDGRLYLGSVVGTISKSANPVTAMVASRSSDGGRSWRVPRYVQPKTGGFWDKPTITADPRRPGRAYFVFDRITGANSTTGLSFISHTRDRGKTWSARRIVLDPRTDDSWPASNILSVLGNGTLLNVGFLYGLETKRVEFLSQQSRDHGATWSPPTKIAGAPNRQPESPTGAVVSALALPSTALAPNGTVDVSWAVLRPDRTSSIRISRSTDGGRSWSIPRDVADVDGEAFLPTIAVAGDGTVGVLYYGTQRDRAGDAEWTTDVWFSYSRDGGRHWRAKRIAGPFDMTTAESHGGELFLGDYEGLAGLPHGFAAAFAQARPKANQGPSDIFFTRLHVTR